MDRLMIIGAGGHGRVIADIADKMNCYSSIEFLDDHAENECIGFPIAGKICDAEKYVATHEFIVAIGNAGVRIKITDQLDNIGARMATLIHPAASIGRCVAIGEGTVVMAGAVINSCAVVGKGCIINTLCAVDHDCVIGDFVHVSVGAKVTGTVKVGNNTWIGAGAVVNNTLSVCGDCMIGSGAVVTKDINDPGTYVGVPAKKRT